MADTMTKRPFFGPSIAQSHRDIPENRYRDLRRPRRVRFFCNGDRYFQGKKLFITPHRYLTFNDLLADLTSKLPSAVQMPYGVRQIYTPVGGHRIRDIEELQDGSAYVCAGFEPFRTIQYGKSGLEPWSHGRSRKAEIFEIGEPGSSSPNGGKGLVGFGGAFHPARPLRQTYPTRKKYGSFGSRTGAGNYWGSKLGRDNGASNAKPRVITVVRHGPAPRSNVKILLNRRSVQSYEQTMADIAEAFGPKWKNDRVRKLFTIRGREVQGISDFFRDDEIFIAVGYDNLTKGDVLDILEEIYPDGPYAKNLAKEWERGKKKRPVIRYENKEDERELGVTNRDSGLGSDSSNQIERDEVIHAGKPNKKEKRHKKGTPLEDMTARIDQENLRAAEDEREKARKRLQKRLEAERRALDDERRKKGMVPTGPIQDPFKKMQEDKEREHREERERQEAEQKLEAEEEAEKMRRKEEAAERRRKRREKKQQQLKAQQEAEENVQVRGEDVIDHSEKDADPVTKNENDNQPKSHPQEEKHDINKNKDKEDDLKSTTSSQKTAKKQNKEHDGYEADDDELKNRKNANKNLDSDLRNDNKREPTLEKDKIDENANKPSNSAKSSSKETEKRLKEHKKSKSKIIHKSKLERQISNADHVLDKYEGGKTLGDGNFAIVRYCKLKNSNSEYAMKVVDKSKLKGKEQMIENEIAIMKQCHHPNIVKLVEEFETKHEIYLIMELVKGGDLFDAITQSVKFNESDSSSMVKDLGNALFYLHSRNIVHRDLKPENLLVCRNKDNTISLKLADFGLAMDVKEPIYTVCGTPTYVAPEILAEIGYGLEVDMWAVGVICYILLCGFPPFRSPDRNQTELFEFIKAGEYEFLSPYWDKISKSAKDLIERLLIVDKKKRYTSTETLCHPWIISQAGTQNPPEAMDVYRKNLRQELDMQARANLHSYKNRHV